MIRTKCPHCGNAHTRAVPMVALAGTSRTWSARPFAGFGRHAFAGVIAGPSQRVSGLSAACACPREPDNFAAFWLACQVAAGVIGAVLGLAVGAGFFMFVVGGLYIAAWSAVCLPAMRRAAVARASYPAKLAAWRAAWLCARCGCTFVPT